MDIFIAYVFLNLSIVCVFESQIQGVLLNVTREYGSNGVLIYSGGDDVVNLNGFIKDVAGLGRLIEVVDVKRNFVDKDVYSFAVTVLEDESQIHAIYKTAAWSLQTKTLVVIRTAKRKAVNILRALWENYKSVNVTVMVVCSNSVKFYTLFPSQKTEDCVEQLTDYTKLFPEKLKNYGGVLKYSSQYQRPYTTLDGDGLDLRILKTLTESCGLKLKEIRVLNQRIYPIRFSNGSLNKYMQLLVTREIDILIGAVRPSEKVNQISEVTVCYYVESVRYMVPNTKRISNLMKLVRVFTVQLWIATLLTFLLSWYAFYFQAVKHKHELSSFKVPIRVLLDTFSILLGEPIPKTPKTTLVRVTFIIIILYSMHINYAYQTALKGSLTAPLKNKYQSVQEAFDDGLDFFVYQGGTSEYFLQHKINKERVKIISDFGEYTLAREAYTKNKSAVTVVTESFFRSDSETRKVFSMLQGNILNYFVAFIMPKGHPLFPLINRKLMHLIESGIVYNWFQNFNTQVVSTKNEEKITLEHIQGPIILWVIGISLAAVVFLLEKATVWFKFK